MMEGMAKFFYLQHYNDVISKGLTKKQKVGLVKRISDLTLERPIWTEHEADYRDQFPELKPLVNTKLSGLYLTTIFEGLFTDLYPHNAKVIGL
jgi:hypothetical protein